MVCMHNELFTMKIGSPIPQSFHNSQHFTICSSIILLCVVKFPTIVGYGVKVLGSCAFLEKYGTKRFSAGISVYFHLGVGTTIIDFKHGPRYNATFKLFKRCLALVCP